MHIHIYVFNYNNLTGALELLRNLDADFSGTLDLAEFGQVEGLTRSLAHFLLLQLLFY